MARSVYLFYILIILIERIRPFAITKRIRFFVDYVNDHSASGTLPISCKCPNLQTAMCHCTNNGLSYSLEAPFAALLLEPGPSVVQWPPSTPFKLLGDLGTLTDNEELLRHLRMMPRPHDEIKSQFFLSTVNNGHVTQSRFDFNVTNLSSWFAIKPSTLYVIIHGWTGSSRDKDVDSFERNLLARKPVINQAVITVDWMKAASNLYKQSATNTIVIAKEIGFVLFKFVRDGLVDSETIHLLGVDMGSHVASMAATDYYERARMYNLQNPKSKIGDTIGRRTGFNPLARHFHKVLSRAGPSDATFVDIIHTTTATSKRIGSSDVDILNRRFGINTLSRRSRFMNQIDFYPQEADACPNEKYGCRLNLAVKYFVASLQPSLARSSFVGFTCAYDKMQYCTKLRSQLRTAIMGIDAPTGARRGNYFVDYKPQLVNELYPQNQTTDSTCQRQSSTIDKDIQITNVQFQAVQDYPNCGYFVEPTARMYLGHVAAPQQFPWAVCIMSSKVYYPEDYKKTFGFFGKLILKDKEHLQWYTPDVTDEWLSDDNRRTVKEPFVRSCSGSLINAQWIVTAAHCFKRIKNLIPIYLVFAATDCHKPPTPDEDHVFRIIVDKRSNSPTRNIFMHPYYNEAPSGSQQYTAPDADIALVKLNEPIKHINFPSGGINPICYHGASQFDYADCKDIKIAGFGLKREATPDFPQEDATLTTIGATIYDYKQHPRTTEQLQTDKFYVAPSANVPDEYFYFANFEDHPLAVTVGRSTSPGDSGGPIFGTRGNRALLVGHVAGGPSFTENKRRMQRHLAIPNSMAGYEDRRDDMIWKLEMQEGIKLAPFITWIDDTISRNPGIVNPNDKFKGKSGAGWLNEEYPDFESPIYTNVVTPRPPRVDPDLPPLLG